MDGHCKLRKATPKVIRTRHHEEVFTYYNFYTVQPIWLGCTYIWGIFPFQGLHIYIHIHIYIYKLILELEDDYCSK